MSIIKNIPKSGTAKVMERAIELGFSFDNPEWVNFGQGAPELGEITGDYPRIKTLKIGNSAAYTPAAGRLDLRQKVANYYNQILSTKLDPKNISIAPGGRGALSRIFASLPKGLKVGYLNPDYTGYKGLFELFNQLEYIEIRMDARDSFRLNVNKIINKIAEENLDVLFFSNPCNPTGQKTNKNELKEIIEACKKNNCLLIHDEFYSRFIYDSKPTFLTALEFQSDLEDGNLIVLDGLTKGFRYPGFRLAWIISSQKNIANINNLASYLDGGVSHPIQLVAKNLLKNTNPKQNPLANLQHNFNQKRQYLLKELLNLGFQVKTEPQGGFYIFANISNFRDRFSNDLEFCEFLLTYKLIIVPGRYFDINPYNDSFKQILFSFVRFSFGLEMAKLEQGVKKMKKIFNF